QAPSSQKSSVQEAPSLQSSGTPAHVPFAQRSPIVHGSPSSHWALSVHEMQPAIGLPPTQMPLWQKSPCVHALPSSHDCSGPSGAWEQVWLVRSQASAVHASPSSHSRGTVPVQVCCAPACRPRTSVETSAKISTERTVHCRITRRVI